MMHICGNGHPEVVHEGWSHCPVCKLKEDYEEKLEDMDSLVAELRDEIIFLKAELENANKEGYEEGYRD